MASQYTHDEAWVCSVQWTVSKYCSIEVGMGGLDTLRLLFPFLLFQVCTVFQGPRNY